ncbi:hypothetical protein D3C76_1686090 [compost metagenome]
MTINFTRIIGNIFHQTLKHGVQTTRADVFGAFVNLPCGFCDAADAIGGEVDIDAFGAHQRFVLLGQRRAWLGQDALEIFGGQRLQFNADRQAALQFRDQI